MVRGISKFNTSKLFYKTSNLTVNDDVSQGFQPGDIWINQSTPAIYQLVTNTEGAADWNQTDAVGSIEGLTNPLEDNLVVATYEIQSTSGNDITLHSDNDVEVNDIKARADRARIALQDHIEEVKLLKPLIENRINKTLD